MLHDYTNMQLEKETHAVVDYPPVPPMITLAWEIIKLYQKDMANPEDDAIYVAASACIVRYFNHTRHEIVVKNGH